MGCTIHLICAPNNYSCTAQWSQGRGRASGARMKEWEPDLIQAENMQNSEYKKKSMEKADERKTDLPAIFLPAKMFIDGQVNERHYREMRTHERGK